MDSISEHKNQLAFDWGAIYIVESINLFYTSLGRTVERNFVVVT
jgi:hypothetical protein